MKGECRVCGCTDNEPCILDNGETCCWATPQHDLCNFCAEMQEENEPLIVPATEYQAQIYIDQLRRGRLS